MNTTCPTCTFINQPGMRFCGKCGTPLGVDHEARYAPGEFRPEQIGAMMGSDLFERFRKAGLEAVGQRRNVTILFVDLSGYTQLSRRLDTEDLYEVVQQLIQVLANDVYKYEGMVDKFTGDGLMALFGAPIAHENNAELAVLSALDMQRDVTALSNRLQGSIGTDLQIHIGIHSGPVIVGGIGSNLLMNYTAIGDTVNLARRLVDATSPGTISVSEKVYRQTRAIFVYKNSDSLYLKGVEQAVRCYQASGIKEKPGRVRGLENLYAPMIGRDQELAKLLAATEALRLNDGGCFVMVTGDAGIGKSRLILEMKEKLQDDEVTVLEGQSLPYRRQVAYWVFLEIIRKLVGIRAEIPEEDVRELLKNKLANLLGARKTEVLPLFEHLLSLSPSDEAAALRLQYLEAGQLRQQVFLAVRELLIAEANKKPLLLILEDLHWADQSSLDLILIILESLHLAPLMVIAVSRPIQHKTLKKITEWAQQSLEEQFLQLSITSLSEEQSEQLLSQLLSIENLPRPFRNYILSRASGVPFFLEEILRMLIDKGMIFGEIGSWSVAAEADIDSAGVPDTLEELILARFDRLHEWQRRVLQVASVIGREFTMSVLQFALPEIAPDIMFQILAELGEKDFVFPQSDSPDAVFSFKHALLSEAIYKTMLRRERSELHGLIGEAIEYVYAHRLEEQVEIIARHYAYSRKYGKALHYLILAGQKSFRNYDNEQARQHYEQALGLLPQVVHNREQEIYLYKGLGDVLVFIGEYNAARENYQKGLQSIVELEPSHSAGIKSSLQRKIGTTYERQGEFQEALECLKQARLSLEDSPLVMPVELAEIVSDISWLHFRWGYLEEAEQALKTALGYAENTTRYDVIASIYNRLGGVYYQKDDLDQASSYVRKSLVLREELGDIVAVARSYNNLGLLYWKQGDWNAALENMERSIELNASLGDIEATLHLHLNIGLLHTDLGDLEKAQMHLEEGLRGARHIGHAFLEGLAEMHISRFWLADKQWQKSLEHSERGLSIFKGIGTQENLVELYISLGEAALNLGDVAKANQAFATGLDTFSSTVNNTEAPNLDLGRLYRLQGNILLFTNEYEQAAVYLKKSIDQFTALKNHIETGRTILSQALLARERKDRMGERILLNEARLIFRQHGARLDLATAEALLSS
jgi:class 3 adenylate cyclase/predicted negative regulator of RcsB-dependent stress response